MKKLLGFLFLNLFISPVFANNTILIMGDSLSSAFGIDVQKGWVALLSERLTAKNYDYDVVNASFPGATTSQGLARLPTQLDKHRPVITIIELGGNDGLRKIPIPEIQRNLQNMITLAKTVKSKVILIGLRLPKLFGEPYVNDFVTMYSNLASSNQIAFVPFFLNDVDEKPNLFQSDRIHPTLDAQSIMLDNVWPVLETTLGPTGVTNK